MEGFRGLLKRLAYRIENKMFIVIPLDPAKCALIRLAGVGE
jgi:hypothetical protein